MLESVLWLESVLLLLLLEDRLLDGLDDEEELDSSSSWRPRM